ncbi:DUF1778 domain-containing protein [Mucilaginibacter robiniae]|uniref:DUF1778 domain-containing protein n=1 Tax=Mucilaginibacter robiniae TaxID=2728022 RepID=A0A7L5E562_9SPHI|nr:DUF1778 domain-containing protein [Mucilaginibacter robiniae]QJD95973.1 DUF1778 domain-containing protein [Mucilaginibacter robiniae]
MSTPVNDRIDVRISTEQKKLVKYASELRGFRSLSEFVVYCINAEATRIINDNNKLLNSLEDKRIFVNALLNPPAPNDKLKKALRTFKKLNKGNGTYDFDTRQDTSEE